MSELLEAIEQDDALERVIRINEKLQRQLRDAKDRNARMVDAVHTGAYEAFVSLGGIPPITAPAHDPRKAKVEVALWDLGDWQYGKANPTYGSAICRDRVEHFIKKARKITEMQRADHPVKDCVIVFGGDMVEGVSFQFPTQPFEIDQTLFGQYVDVGRLLVDVVRHALSIYEHVVVSAEWGNHGRIGSKRDTVPRNDNIDRMTYHFAREMLRGEERLTWPDCPEDIQRVEIGNYRALNFHGDEIGRNGYASPNTLVNWLTRQQSGAYEWEFTDGYVHHFHTAQSWSLPGKAGRLFMNGSTETGNNYASITMASASTPSQRLHFIDPERGRVTAEYVLWLDRKEVPDGRS